MAQKAKLLSAILSYAMGVDLSKPVQCITKLQYYLLNVEINYDLRCQLLPVRNNSGMRNVVAQRLTESSRDIPSFLYDGRLSNRYLVGNA